MSQRRRAAEIAEKKAADAIRADDIIEDVIPESKSWNPEKSQSSNGKPQLAGAAAKAKLGAAEPKGKDTEVKQLEEMADEEEKEKTMKFDKSKKESEGKPGEPRTHEKIVSTGKKGASVRWSKERQEQEGGLDPDYQLNEENEDDKEAYKEEFQEEPVEEEENFEEEGEDQGEDQGEGENKEDRMHKIRVEAGKKALATRKAHIKEQDPSVKSDKDADAVLHHQLSAIGKKGASARWSRDKDEDNGGDEENQGEEEDKEARLHNIRVQAGKKAMATRRQHIREQDPGVQSDEEADAVLHDQLSAIGKKGAAARWSRDKGHGGDQSEGEEEDEEEKEARMHETRVQAGKKAMATRKQRLKEQDPGVQSDEEADAVLHEQLSAIGKKGASARWAREKGESSAEEEEGDEDENEKAARLHKIRVEAGKKAAATRKAHAQQQQNSAGESEEEEPSTHEKLAAAGKKGASARWARAKKRDSEGESEGANGNMKKARASSRVAMEHWKALEIQELFLQNFADLVVEMNVSVPRRGAFEIIVTNSRGVETTLWSGLKRGPPRRLKFPDPNTLIEGLKEALA